MQQGIEDWLPTRHTLIGRLKGLEDQESWREFFDLYGKLIYGVARRRGLAHEEAQDVVQETVLSVARKIETFKPGREVGSFKAWLGQLIRWRIVDQVRKRGRGEPLANALPPREVGSTRTTSTRDRLPDPAGDQFQETWDAEWASAVVETAMARLKKRVRPKHYQIFQMHVLAERPVEEVAAAFGVRPAQVHLIKHRVSALLQKELAAVEAANV